MALVRRILMDLLISATAPERFELCGLWGPSAATPEAHARGIKLLEENLSPAQRYQYKVFGYFDVAGGETGRRYRIRYGSQMNVEQLGERGEPVRVLCFMPEGKLVVGDIMLAQKLALELFESDTLKAANRFSSHPCLFGPMP
jgi:hypothetical protein